MLLPEGTAIEQTVFSTPSAVLIHTVNTISLAFNILSTGQDYSYQQDLLGLVSQDLRYSQVNFDWIRDYWQFAIVTVSLSRRGVEQNLRAELTPETWELFEHRKFVSDHITFDNPDDIELHLHNPYYNKEYLPFLEKLPEADSVVVSRAIIGLMTPCFEDFLSGAPVWLKDCTSGIVLTAYDPENRKHIKIVKDGKRYKYYTSIISDNYKEIKQVPEEMDALVSYLISYRN